MAIRLPPASQRYPVVHGDLVCPTVFARIMCLTYTVKNDAPFRVRVVPSIMHYRKRLQELLCNNPSLELDDDAFGSGSQRKHFFLHRVDFHHGCWLQFLRHSTLRIAAAIQWRLLCNFSWNVTIHKQWTASNNNNSKLMERMCWCFAAQWVLSLSITILKGHDKRLN